jgi:hypothetical protein
MYSNKTNYCKYSLIYSAATIEVYCKRLIAGLSCKRGAIQVQTFLTFNFQPYEPAVVVVVNSAVVVSVVVVVGVVVDGSVLGCSEKKHQLSS